MEVSCNCTYHINACIIIESRLEAAVEAAVAAVVVDVAELPLGMHEYYSLDSYKQTSPFDLAIIFTHLFCSMNTHNFPFPFKIIRYIL